jgi:acetyl esterase/lipase
MMRRGAAGSWQLRVVDKYIRMVVKTASWGEPAKLARRARRHFGAPVLWGRLVSRGLKIQRADEGGIRGEWIEPEESKPGVILYMHGGGYVACSPRTHRSVTARLARLTQLRVFSLDYRLAPERPFPAAYDDAIAAYSWLSRQEDSIAVAGDSAGGGLALALLAAARDLALVRPACGVLFSPWTDLAGTGESGRVNAGRCAMFEPANGEQFARAYLGTESPSDPRASPLFQDLGALPPVLLEVGETAVLLDDSRRVDERIRSMGGESFLNVLPNVSHGWQLLDGIVPEARESLVRAAAFIGQHCRVGWRTPAHSH